MLCFRMRGASQLLIHLRPSLIDITLFQLPIHPDSEFSEIPQFDTVISARSPWSDHSLRRNQQRLLSRGELVDSVFF